MKITDQNNWIDTVSGLAKLSHASPAGYDRALEDIVRVVSENATASKPFAYLKFEASQDWAMTLEEIAKVFTQEDYLDMVQELVVEPAKIMAKFISAADNDPLMAEVKTNKPDLVGKMVEVGLKSLIIEIGEHPISEDTPAAGTQENKRPRHDR